MDLSNVTRSLKVERLYTLGDYQNIKLTDEINNLPPEILSNPHAVELLRTLQFAQMDLAHQKYIKMTKAKANFRNQDDLIAELEQLRINTLDELEHLNKGE